MEDREQLQLEQRRTRDRSLALLVTGIVLLMPPIAGVALVESRVAGIPMPILYVFVVWIGLIVGAARLSRKLSKDANSSDRTSDRTSERDAT